MLQELSVPLTGEKNKLTTILNNMNELPATTQAMTSPVASSSKDIENDAIPRHEYVSFESSPKTSYGLSAAWVMYGFIFFAAAISAIDFMFGASKAIERYPFGKIEFCKDNAIASSVWTNFFFNWMAYIDLFEHEEKIEAWYKVFALFAGASTIAPYFFIGFVGALWQKILVAISTFFNLPVFYFGALDFYDYFHADFVQQVRWLLRFSLENFQLASKKSAIVFNMKENYNYFSFASREERERFINQFIALNGNEQLNFLIDRNGEFKVERSWARWFFCAGSGPVVGIATLAQNIGHVVVTMDGILAIKAMPLEARWFLAVSLGLGNFVPSLGYSFATMANFDLIDFVRACLFLDVPQLQRVIERDSWSATIAVRVALSVFRYLYVTSGFSNDEVNEEGAVILGANKQAAQVAGIDGNVSGAVVFNGVLNEKLFRRVLGWGVDSLEKADAEDKRQLAFEKMYKKMLDVVMQLPLQEGIKSFKTSDDPSLKAFTQRFFPAPEEQANIVVANPVHVK